MGSWVVVSNIFYFHPDPWGFMIQFDEHIFQMGLVQPPTIVIYGIIGVKKPTDPITFDLALPFRDIQVGLFGWKPHMGFVFQHFKVQLFYLFRESCKVQLLFQTDVLLFASGQKGPKKGGQKLAVLKTKALNVWYIYLHGWLNFDDKSR